VVRAVVGVTGVDADEEVEMSALRAERGGAEVVDMFGE